MNSAPHLLPEDRPEFERVLDEALRTAPQRPAPAALGERLDAEQLRTMALSAATAIAECAAVEYEHFVGLRTELRQPASAQRGREREQRSDESTGKRDGPVLAGAMGEGITETSGAGLAAMVSVLVPLLAGTAAVIFLLLGYLLQVTMSPEPAIAAPIRGAGWVFAVLAAAGIVVGMAELWLTAMRNGAGARRAAAEAALAPGAGTGMGGAGVAGGLADEVAKARAAWREALLERGILPFLSEALTDPPGPHAPSGEERTPRLGYSGPDFSSRTPSDGMEERSTRLRYSSPDYSSPDYGGPGYGRPAHGGPDSAPQ